MFMSDIDVVAVEVINLNMVTHVFHNYFKNREY